MHLLQIMLLALVLLAILQPSPTSGAGMSMHSVVGKRALFWFNSPSHPEYREILERLPTYWQPGTFFPDWGYNCRGFGEEAEAAHWPPFINSTAVFIREKYPKPWSQEVEGLVSFLFGIMSHSVADDSWHSLGMSEGLVEFMQFTEFRGSYGDAHSAADLGGEFALKFLADLSDNAQTTWEVPAADLVEAYNQYFQGQTAVTEEDIHFCMRIGFAGIWANQILGDLALPLTRSSPFLLEEVEQYFLGGLDDMATWSARCWEDVARWLEADGPTRPMCTLLENQWGSHEKEREKGRQKGHVAGEDQEGRRLRGQEAVEYLASHGFEILTEELGKGRIRTSLVREDGRAPEEYLAELSRKVLEEEEEEEEKGKGGEMLQATCVKEDLFQNNTLQLEISTPYSQLGHAVAKGDFNGDGIDDLAVGAPGYGGPGRAQVGAVYVIYGRKDLKPEATVLQGVEALADVILYGQKAYDRFGFSLSSVDLNKDGISDLAISSPTSNGLEMYYDGRIQVLQGSRTGLLTSLPLLSITTQQPFPDVDPSAAHPFKFTLLGYRLQAGDVDGDGFDDLLVASPLAAPRGLGYQRGLVSVFYSSSAHQGSLDVYEGADLEFLGSEDYQRFGSDVSVVKDAQGESLILIGSNFSPNSDVQAAGKVYGYSVSNLNAPLFIISGTDELQKFGSSIVAGDFFANNQTLVAVSSISEQIGRTWQAGGVRILDLTDVRGEISLGDLRAVTTLQGGERAAHFGFDLAIGGDALWISEPFYGNYRSDEQASTGLIYSFKYGSSFPSGTVRNRAEESSSCVIGKEIRGRFGHRIITLDLNADGIEDLVVSSVHSSSGSDHSGLVSVFFG